ncbi:restriction endonuclease [Streptomyces sp. NPDC008313]|uniref:restriction endonuclease n=1 Tax=Streptomyces sp. NPDC008313 TaxID=3364826 RepID=UPI0036F10E88
MAVPVHREPRAGRGRSFDLRSTALFFGLAALVLCSVGFVVRTAVGALEHRPALVAVACLTGLPALVLLRRGRRRFSAARLARRAAAALDEATEVAEVAVETLDTGESARSAVVGPPPAAGGEHEPYPVMYTSVDYDVLDADEFEAAVAALCERDGCVDVEVVGGAGDLGADVVATAPDGRRVILQCKRYREDNKVGSQDLQRFGGTCFTVHDAEVAAVVTTSGFTEPAAEYAGQCGILCFDGDDLRAWSDGTGPAPWAPAASGGCP